MTQTYGILLNHWGDVFDHFAENTSATYGDQISPEDKVELEKDDRPVVNRNIILPAVLEYLGSTLKRRRSVMAYPVDNTGDVQVAEALSKMFKHTEQDNDLDVVGLDVRAIAIITNMGWYYIPPPPSYPQSNEDLLVKIYCEPPENILLDADARDLEQRSWKRIIRRSWLSMDEITGLWPEFAEEIQGRISKGDDTWTNLSERLKMGVRRDTTVANTDTNVVLLSSQDVVDKVNRLYLILELWERKYKNDGNYRNQDYMQLRLTMPYLDMGLGRYDLPLKYYPFVLLQNINFGSTIIDTRSYVDQLRALQDEKNRETAIMEDTASRGIAETLILNRGETQLKKDIMAGGSKPGVYEAATDNPIAGRINAGGINPGAIANIQQIDADIERVRILPPAVGGRAENQNESGTYFDSKLAQGEQSIEIFSFIEWKKTLKLLYRIILERYQVYYTPEMTLRILGDNPGEFEDVNINQMDWLTGKILNDITTGRYDVTIDDVDYSNSTRIDQVKTLSVVLQTAPPQIQALIWPELLKNLPLDKRNELSAMAEKILAPFVQQPQAPTQQSQLQGGRQQIM